MALFKRGNTWYYEFMFARRRVRESAKTTSKTVAKLAEQNRRRGLEGGFNGIQDKREERIRSIRELSRDYLDDHGVCQHKWRRFRRGLTHNSIHTDRFLRCKQSGFRRVRDFRKKRAMRGAARREI